MGWVGGGVGAILEILTCGVFFTLLLQNFMNALFQIETALPRDE